MFGRPASPTEFDNRISVMTIGVIGRIANLEAEAARMFGSAIVLASVLDFFPIEPSADETAEYLAQAAKSNMTLRAVAHAWKLQSIFVGVIL